MECDHPKITPHRWWQRSSIFFWLFPIHAAEVSFMRDYGWRHWHLPSFRLGKTWCLGRPETVQGSSMVNHRHWSPEVVSLLPFRGGMPGPLGTRPCVQWIVPWYAWEGMWNYGWDVRICKHTYVNDVDDCRRTYVKTWCEDTVCSKDWW